MDGRIARGERMKQLSIPERLKERNSEKKLRHRTLLPLPQLPRYSAAPAIPPSFLTSTILSPYHLSPALSYSSFFPPQWQVGLGGASSLVKARDNLRYAPSVRFEYRDHAGAGPWQTIYRGSTNTKLVYWLAVSLSLSFYALNCVSHRC